MTLKKKHRILMTGDAMGGVWTYVCELAECMEKFDFEIILAIMGASPSDQQYNQIRSIKNVVHCYHPFKLEWMEKPWSDVDEAGEWLLSLEKTYGPDIVHINGYAHVSLPWKVPVVCVAHSCVYSWFSHVKKKLPDSSWNEYWRRVRDALLSASIVIAPSNAMLSDLESHYVKIRRSKVIYNGRSKSIFGYGKKEPVIFASGRIWDEAKNLKFLAEISRYLKWPLYIAGLGNVKDTCVNHLGLLSESQMISWYSRASIFIHTALYEPFGLSVLEAAYSNCALILSDIKSLHEIWKDCAVYVNPASKEEIIEAVEKMIKNNEVLDDLAKRAKLQSQFYSGEKMCREYVQIYNDLI